MCYLCVILGIHCASRGKTSLSPSLPQSSTSPHPDTHKQLGSTRDNPLGMFQQQANRPTLCNTFLCARYTELQHNTKECSPKFPDTSLRGPFMTMPRARIVLRAPPRSALWLKIFKLSRCIVSLLFGAIRLMTPCGWRAACPGGGAGRGEGGCCSTQISATLGTLSCASILTAQQQQQQLLLLVVQRQ